MLLYVFFFAMSGRLAHGLVHRSDLVHHREQWECDAGMPGMISESNWTAVDDQIIDSANPNLCIDGREVPELYVIGAPKCATTSIGVDLVGAGFKCANHKKEFSFWLHGNLVQPTTDEIKHAWLSAMPTCSNKERSVVVDNSPLYMSTEGTAIAIKNVYGAQANRMVFVVMLREPLSRMRSWWYYTRTGRSEESTGTFSRDVEKLLKDIDSGEEFNSKMKGLLWHSTYGSQLAGWFETFSPSQFVVIPLKAYSDGGGLEVCSELTKRLNYKMRCTPEVSTAGVQPSEDHAKLEDDTSPELRNNFAAMMRTDNQLLVQTLEDGHDHGTSLLRYEGEGIATWLQKWW